MNYILNTENLTLAKGDLTFEDMVKDQVYYMYDESDGFALLFVRVQEGKNERLYIDNAYYKDGKLYLEKQPSYVKNILH